MRKKTSASWPWIVVLWCSAGSWANSRAADAPASAEPIVARFVHPERQAAEVLRLFEGTSAPHPAAALAAWKQASHEPDRLGKPLEAVISFFNPEMVREWSTFHNARFQLGLDPTTGAGRWAFLVPHDDGSLAAMITSLCLSGGAEEPPLEGGKLPVERLGGSGQAVALRGSNAVILASSRDELKRAWKSATKPDDPAQTEEHSGLHFRIEPERINGLPQGDNLTRRAIELARGLDCRSIEGTLGLHDGRLALEVTSLIKEVNPVGPAAAQPRRIDPGWLSWMPAQGAAAVICIATGARATYWDKVFAVADRVDRADPERANLAPLRTRLNLLATAAGARLELDLWPHLRGLTLGLLAKPNSSAGLQGAFLALQLDQEGAARKLFDDTIPRLATLGRGMKPAANSTETRSLGKVSGRPLVVSVRGRTVLVAWSEGTLATILQVHEQPEQSVQALFASHLEKCPDRLGAFWPGRICLPIKGLDGSTPLTQALAEGVPIVWTGWNEGELARDRVSWSELRSLVRRFLSRIPLDRTVSR